MLDRRPATSRTAPEPAWARPAPGRSAGWSAQRLIDLQRSAGNRAVGAVRGGRGPVLQRVVAWGQRADDSFNTFLDALSVVVEQKAEQALDVDTLPDSAMVENLRDAVAVYDLAHRQQVPPFLYARYGYVVEELVNQQIAGGALDPHLPPAPGGHRYAIKVQGGRGTTRPDVIVELWGRAAGDKRDVAWFDISSSTRSEQGGTLHIDDKTGWDRRAFAGEAQYPTLDPLRLGTGTMSPAEGVLLRHRLERFEAQMHRRHEKIDQCIALAKRERERGSHVRQREHVEESLAALFHPAFEGHKLTPATTKAILGRVGRVIHDQDNYWIAAFGYHKTSGRRDQSALPDVLVDSVDPS